jgi:hypothetical protein
MRTSGCRSRIPTAGGLLFTSLLALVAGAAALRAEKRASGTELWQGKEITYELSGDTRSDVQFHKSERDCRIITTIDGRERTVLLRGEDVDVDGEHFDVGSYIRVALNAKREFLIVSLVTTRSWGANASGSASSQAASGTSTIVIKPGLVSVDGVARTADPVAPLRVSASKDSLRITAGQSEIWTRD